MVIPQRKVVRRRPPHPPPRAFDPLLYRLRNLVERTIGRLKHYRRVATRYEKTARNYAAFVTIAATAIWLK